MVMRIINIVLALLLSMPVLRAQESATSSSSNLSDVVEHNAQMGFNDTIDRMADDFIRASLVIASPGEVLYSILGHAAIRLQSTTYDLDYIFSYESESVHGRVLRFLANDLKMGMVALPVDIYLQPYKEDGRGVKEYPMNLPPEVEIELWRILDEKVAEGMDLPYDYIDRGCVITIVRVIDEAIASANAKNGTHYELRYPELGKDFDRTLREIVYDNSPEGWQRFFGMTLVGGKVDSQKLAPTDKLIIPRELVSVWENTTINNTPILGSSEELLPLEREYKGDAFSPFYASLLVLVLAIGGLFWRKPYIDWLILGMQTILGVLMVWLLISPLPGSEWSWLIIPFNPLPILFWKWRDQWCIPYAVLMVIWSVGMMCAPHRLVEAAHIILVYAFMIVILKQTIIKKYNQKNDAK